MTALSETACCDAACSSTDALCPAFTPWGCVLRLGRVRLSTNKVYYIDLREVTFLLNNLLTLPSFLVSVRSKVWTFIVYRIQGKKNLPK